MRAVVQRVTRASVTVDGEIVGAIDRGLLVLLGAGTEDTPATARRLAARIATLRIHKDVEGRMNLDLAAAGGAILVVSQFTLYADASRGHRPSFIRAARPDQAIPLVSAFTTALREEHCLEVAEGRFGADMAVELVNDGPVTVVLSIGEPGWEADAG